MDCFLSLGCYNWLICFISSICWFPFKSKIISTQICKETSNVDLRKFPYLFTLHHETSNASWDLIFLLIYILSFQVSRVTSHFSMNATHFSQLKWLCVLQLIHDDNSFPGERLPCWVEKMDWSLLLSFCCHSSIGRKPELALNCRISHWYLPGLLPKQNLTDSSRYSGEMESVIIPFLLPYILKIASTAEIRDSLKSVDISCTRHASSSNKECVWVILCHIQPITVGASISPALLYLQQTAGVREENGASGQRKPAAGNQIWLQSQRTQSRSYECWVPKRAAMRILLE